MKTFKLDSKVFISDGIRTFIITSDLPSEGELWVGYINDEPWLEAVCKKADRSNRYFEITNIYKQNIDFIPDYTVFKKEEFHKVKLKFNEGK